MLRSHFQAHGDSCWFILKVMDMSWSHCSDEQNKPVTVSCSNVCLHNNHQGICRSCVNAVGIGMGSTFPTWTLLILCLKHWWVAGVLKESAQAQFTISKSMNSKVTLSEVFLLPAPRFPWFIFPEIAFAGSFWVQEKTGYLVPPQIQLTPQIMLCCCICPLVH